MAQESVPAGGIRHQPAPNGGEARGIPDAQSKMPKNQKVKPIQHTPLAISSAQMPRKSSQPAQTEPHRR